MQVHAYGKINLYLDVLNRRPDGFTNIETIFQTVDVYDTLHFELRPSGLSLTSSDPELETDDSNLILRAANLLQMETGCDKGVHIHLEKRIPIAGGMAGGSVDAAATLRALNVLWNLDMTEDDLAECALQLGSDVPYCLVGGTAAATGRGEVLDRLPALPATWFVLLRPELSISAGDVYNHPALTRNAEGGDGERTSAFTHALDALCDGRVANTMFNRMESAIFAMHPELIELRDALLELECTAAIVSGSGPTLAGLCRDESEATRIADALKDYSALPVQTVESSVAFV